MTTVPLDELPEFVRNVRAMLKLSPHKDSAVIVALRGELGSGKTTFVQALARDMGIGEALVSPTYVLMKKYAVPEGRLLSGALRRFKTLVHIDAYRLEKPEEFAALRSQEFLSDPGALVLVEWPEKAAGFLPEPDMTLNFSSEGLPDSARDIEIQSMEAQ